MYLLSASNDFSGDSDEEPEPTATTGNGRHRKKRPEVVPVVEYDCEPRSESYRTADPKQCDKYEWKMTIWPWVNYDKTINDPDFQLWICIDWNTAYIATTLDSIVESFFWWDKRNYICQANLTIQTDYNLTIETIYSETKQSQIWGQSNHVLPSLTKQAYDYEARADLNNLTWRNQTNPNQA